MLIRRRELLIGTAALAVSAGIPTLPSLAAPTKIIPAWAVGTPGEFNWQHIVAETAERAERLFRNENCDFECEEGSPCGECEGCTLDVEAERKPIWDGKSSLTSADWLRGGSGTYCARCNYETFPEGDGHPVGDEAVCHDCMTLADWDIVDPERAAEIRADR